jgi:hypothetical protein
MRGVEVTGLLAARPERKQTIFRLKLPGAGVSVPGVEQKAGAGINPIVFRKTATAYDTYREAGINWLSCAAKLQSGITLG